MFVYRIERLRYLETVLSGRGSAMSDGCRWNSLHTALVYTSASRALALLEVSVHLDIHEDLPDDRYIVTIEIPDHVAITHIPLTHLPRQWDTKPPVKQSQHVGDKFVASMETAVLQVPSCIVSQEYNYLINPLHRDAHYIRVVETAHLLFDSRIHKKELNW